MKLTKEEALAELHCNITQWPEDDASIGWAPDGWAWRNMGEMAVLVPVELLNSAVTSAYCICFAEWSRSEIKNDVGSHYRFIFKHKITEVDMERGYAMVKTDPYRVCKIYGVDGGPREHIIKKALRGKGKGHSELELVNELQSCLDRWKEMLNEDS